jgi:hypothetical protein
LRGKSQAGSLCHYDGLLGMTEKKRCGAFAGVGFKVGPEVIVRSCLHLRSRNF